MIGYNQSINMVPHGNYVILLRVKKITFSLCFGP